MFGAGIFIFIVGLFMYGLSIFSMSKKAPRRMLWYTMAFAYSGEIGVVLGALMAIISQV